MSKKWLLLIIFLPSLHANDFMDAVNINIYPEYYYKGVMVELETIVDINEEETEISFNVPSNTDSVFLITGLPDQDKQIIPLNIEHVKETKTIDFILSEPQFRLFVFFNPFDENEDKSFSYSMGSNIEMKNVHLAIQEPVMAKNFIISREVTSETKDQHGINFKAIHLGDIQAGNQETISVSYTNISGKTTIENLREQLRNTDQSKAPLTAIEERPIRHTLLLWEPLVILGVLSLVIGLNYYSKKKSIPETKNNYCVSCGNKLENNAKFCSSCGEKVK